MENDEDNFNGYEETPEFFDENVRIFHTLVYALARANEDELLSKLEDLGDKLDNEEDIYLSEFNELIAEIIQKLRSKYTTLDIFKKHYPNPEVERLMLRFEIQHLINLIDENTESNYLKDVNDFLKFAAHDFHAAIEKWDNTLITLEDLIMAHLAGDDEEIEQEDIQNT
ncbi:hypothetical protein [Leptospira kanakyensis]|uniref:hypothetical protein n=1 Tax=Leptospira kanakyensis TaxID=2484968 RepID=UPI00223D3CF7|nr:hypothetical protein [Leptospira kanakyensis]MCW7471687.1 hypothetical protein [Leptospira kanakyensis]MCW7483290.1 hypothetical protein [Leptospira kanakyensis]